MITTKAPMQTEDITAHLVTVTGQDTSGPWDFYFGNNATVFLDRGDAEEMRDELAADAVFGVDGDKRLDEVGARYTIQEVNSLDACPESYRAEYLALVSEPM